VHLSLAEFCELIDGLPTNAEKALSVLWYHDQREPDIAMKAGALAKILDDHRVGTPNSTKLAAQISETRLANESTKGFSLKPGSRKIIHDWLPQTTSHEGASDAPPSFKTLVSDVRMQQINERRWNECVICLRYGAPLAAVVMMGGLLESLFVSKQKEFPDKGAMIGASRAPQHKGQKLPLQKWTLNDYIEVGNELGWIGDAAKRVSTVLRDYRNIIHPEVEHAQKASVEPSDARLMWSVTKSLILELLR
jgi:hypothetical protein